MKIPNGSYTVVLENGKHVTFKVKTCKKGSLMGNTIIGYRTKINKKLFYKSFGFVKGKYVNFWRRFRESHSVEFIEKIQDSIKILQVNTYAAGKAYAFQSGNCFVCRRELTNPESIEAGIGPECRRKFFMK